MSIKISELPQATSVGSSDIVPIVQGGTTKQATAGMMTPQIEDITNQVTFTAESEITELGRTVYKQGNTITLVLTCQYASRSAGVFSLGTLSLTPLYQCYGVGTGYRATVGTFGAFGRINTSGVVTAITTSDTQQVTFNIDFPLATQTRSLNLTKSENTGSLVGLGDKAEFTDETLEKTKLDEVTEVKEAEAKTEEIEKEGSGDER